MKALLNPFAELTEFREAAESIRLGKSGIRQISGCIETQKAHVVYGLGSGRRYRLIIAEDDRKAEELYEDYRFYDPDAMLYPARDILFFQADIHGNLLTKQRMRVIREILEEKPVTVITSIAGCMDSLVPPEEIRCQVTELTAGKEIDIEQLKSRLVHMGYERSVQVEASGQFSVRGGIIDVFPLTEELPWRIELWGDEIDSIRSFETETQRSVENLESIRIYPAVEHVPEGKSVCFPEYFSRQDTILFLDEPNRIMERADTVEAEFCDSIQNRMENDFIVPGQERLLRSRGEVTAVLNRFTAVSLSIMEPKADGWEILERYQSSVQSVSGYHNSFEMLVHDLQSWRQGGYRVLLLCSSRTRAQRLANDLLAEGLMAFYCESPDREIRSGEIMVTGGHARRGFLYTMIKFVVISDTDIFGREKRKQRKRKEYSGTKISSFSELNVGDYVVHENHGLGIYRGIEKIEVDRILKDYIRIEYAGKSNLYIMATQLDSLQKYAGSESGTLRLNTLGDPEWNRTRNRVRREVKNIAHELVELYAVRQSKDGYAYGKDTVWQREFEEMFPFEETEDQLQAIEDTKRDMESPRIMDRLICGDVGYGKTEIAIRAAFKAVQESKQVAFLVPTTILAQQHYNTFTQRMKDFPVRIDLLSRFRTPAEQKKTIEDLKKGYVDIVIGTHRLLSKDVVYKDLGLLVVDEEQRFGVTHKEKIKQLKKDVDVLTLTATPIPRTLHMSLIGIRDMSVLDEPPMDRMPIQTYVMEYNDEVVREAVTRELARGGQVYYVYNRVNHIAEVAGKIAKLVPDAVVAYAHGQMQERKLEKIMYRFIEGEIDILVTTTIIETGLDIANVNTMIVQDADRMGLSQLYQLRGRVGRSNRTAYAFLMYRRDRMLQETAEKRLHAIREYTDLGSGFRIAMRDLEIRGAGNLLGAEQHGHMDAVGYDLYCKMLTEAIREEKGQKKQEEFETTIDISLSAYIPETYIPDEMQKLDIYKRIAGISSKEDYEDMLEELMDRFGEPPKSVQNLLTVANLKALAHAAYVTEIRQSGREIRLTMYEKAKLDPAGIPALVEHHQGELVFRTDKTSWFLYRPAVRKKGRSPCLTELIQELLEEILSFAEK